MAEFFAAYLLTTWFGPAFPISPLLWLTGDHGAGKSRLLALLASMAHLGLYLPVPPPPAALRALAGLGASLAVDDADVLADQPRPSAWSSTSRRAILLAGRQRGALLPITLPENSGSSGLRRTHQLDISGPRLFAAAGQPHPAVARYFIVVPLVRTAQARLSAVDPADPASWPSDISPTDLIDDLWSLSLSRLHELAPHLPLAAAAAAQPDQRQPESSIFYPPLQGAALQPWHSVLAVASWLNAAGVSGLFARLLALSQAYQADRPAPENADLSVLVLKALLECASQRLTELNSARFRSNDVDDDPDVHDIHDADDAQTLNSEQSVSALERNLEATQRQIEETLAHGDIVPLTALPAVLSVSAALVLDAMRLARVGQRWDVPLETLTTRRVGQILSNLGLSPHRMATTRSWNITPAALARLARAYGLPLPDFLSAHFASFIDPSSPAPPP